MRITLVLAVSAAVGTACACGDGTPGKPRSPLGSFEARCEALPPIAPSVVASPIGVIEDTSRALAQLTAMSTHGRPNHQTMGLTQTSVGTTTTVRAEGLTDRAGRACMRARVEVVLSMDPMTVFVAREIAADRCRHDEVRAHEQKHVEVHEAFLRDQPAELLAHLADAGIERVYNAASAAAAQHDIELDVARAVARFEATSRADLARRQAEVDTPEEYARVAAACGPLHAPPTDEQASAPDRR